MGPIPNEKPNALGKYENNKASVVNPKANPLYFPKLSMIRNNVIAIVKLKQNAPINPNIILEISNDELPES